MTDITTITLPASVTEIGNGAFSSCESLQTVTVMATTPPTLGGDVFRPTLMTEDYNEGLQIFVPSNQVNTYKTAWSTYADIIYAIS